LLLEVNQLGLNSAEEIVLSIRFSEHFGDPIRFDGVALLSQRRCVNK
jgi:hypothetical protein